MRRTLACLFLALLAAAPAAGHGLFFLAGAEADTLAVGHGAVAADGHGGHRPLPADQIVRLVHVDRSGRPRPLPLDGPWALAPADGMAAFAVVDWGWWYKTAEGTVQGDPEGVAGVLLSWRARDTVKRLRAWHPQLTRPLGDELQLCPLEDPFAKQLGEKLRVCAWLDGRPAPGVVVAYDHDVRGETDADGCINIRLRESGPQILRATLRRPLDGTAHAEDVRTTTLDFHLEAR